NAQRTTRTTPPFPTRRSSDLKGDAMLQHRDEAVPGARRLQGVERRDGFRRGWEVHLGRDAVRAAPGVVLRAYEDDGTFAAHRKGDRKSTRLNSSHVKNSYAVF